MSRRALLIVDAQPDFCEGGALAVEGGNAVCERIGAYLDAHGADYDLVVASRDWHIEPGTHFSSNPDYVATWPPHCVAGTPGAAYHPAVQARIDRITAHVRKGQRTAAYSAFEGHDDEGRDLATILDDAGITELDVCGLAVDYCDRASVLDARRAGLPVRFLADLAAGVAPASTAAALDEMAGAGAVITTADAG